MSASIGVHQFMSVLEAERKENENEIENCEPQIHSAEILQLITQSQLLHDTKGSIRKYEELKACCNNKCDKHD